MPIPRSGASAKCFSIRNKYSIIRPAHLSFSLFQCLVSLDSCQWEKWEISCDFLASPPFPFLGFVPCSFLASHSWTCLYFHSCQQKELSNTSPSTVLVKAFFQCCKVDCTSLWFSILLITLWERVFASLFLQSPTHISGPFPHSLLTTSFSFDRNSSYIIHMNYA